MNIMDTGKQAFEISRRNIISFARLREKILANKKTVDLKSLQRYHTRYQGKCVSFSLAARG